jgi:aromatic ring-opening dioxygenase catalytic subunit (LigB family)
MSDRLPTYFISHGGGPWPWLSDLRAKFVNLEASLKQMGDDLKEKPRAIMMISAHWETTEIAVQASPKPPMVYDYYGFPRETYEIVYPAPGAPAMAQKALALLKRAGIAALLDHERGFDHGTFAPLAIMYPDADMPVF